MQETIQQHVGLTVRRTVVTARLPQKEDDGTRRQLPCQSIPQANSISASCGKPRWGKSSEWETRPVAR